MPSDLPAYLLKRIPDDLRARLSSEAAEQDRSVSDVIRAALCAHYGFDCPPLSAVYVAERDAQAETILLRMQPRLFKAVQREARRRKPTKSTAWTARRGGEPMRTVILDVLEAHYNGGK